MNLSERKLKTYWFVECVWAISSKNQPLTEKGFQIDADYLALSANQIGALWKSANQRQNDWFNRTLSRDELTCLMIKNSRHPVQLSCQHIFCYECLALTQHTPYDEFSCPHCCRRIRRHLRDLKRPRFTMKVMEICSKGIINLKKEEIEKITKKTEDVSADSIESIDWSLYLPRVTFTS